MSFENRDRLIVEYTARSCTLSDRTKTAFEEDLELPARVVEDIPSAVVHVEVADPPRSRASEVKLDLVLAGQLDLFARETEVPAERVPAPVAPDLVRMQAAVEAQDHPSFRGAIAIYQDSLRKRIGRRIELEPDVAAGLGDRFTIDDGIEDVFRNAFEGFSKRPHAPAGLGEWLESSIDRSIREVAESPEVRHSISFARSAHSAGGEMG